MQTGDTVSAGTTEDPGYIYFQVDEIGPPTVGQSKSKSSLTGTFSTAAIFSRFSNFGPYSPRSMLLIDSTVKLRLIG